MKALLRRLVEALHRWLYGETDEDFCLGVNHSTTVFVVEGEDASLLHDVAVPIFGEHVFVGSVKSDAALDELDRIGQTFDVAFSQ